MTKPHVIIVTPAAPSSNNGNWRTAARWRDMLKRSYRVSIAQDWQGEACDVLLALHARRSHAAIMRYRAAHPQGALLVALTGTDLYGDLPAGNAQVPQSLVAADRLIVLQPDALNHLDRASRRKARVVIQSATALKPMRKKPGILNVVVVGHLRREKDPRTVYAAAHLLDADLPIHISHIGDALDEQFAKEARRLAEQRPQYRWIGALPHGLTRSAIKRAHVLVHPSILEGGAHVVIEAAMSGTPVIASRMSGNVGLLGADYPGYFEVGDARALATLLQRALLDRAFYRQLCTATAKRTRLFTPAQERRSILAVVKEALH